MELTAYTLDGHQLAIRPAPVERAWMEATDERFAYRCLPLNIANAHGWEVLSPCGFKALWTGHRNKEGVKVFPDPGTAAPALGHFGHGVLTFHIAALFRTEPGYDLLVQGPVNAPKDAIAPLSGIIETDWAPYTFTMNWKFTRTGTIIRFEKDEPFCHLFPVKRGEIEGFVPRLAPLRAYPELERQYTRWTQARAGFIGELDRPDSKAVEEKWQKLYYRGLDADGNEAKPEDHRTRLRLRPFES